MTVVSCGYGAVRYFLFSSLLCPEKVAVEGTEISSFSIYLFFNFVFIHFMLQNNECTISQSFIDNYKA